MAIFVLQPESGSNRAYLKLKTSIIWPFTENADKPLVQSYRLRRNSHIKEYQNLVNFILVENKKQNKTKGNNHDYFVMLLKGTN